MFFGFSFLCSMTSRPLKRNYFQYLLKSKGRHGVHSAFVFDFVDKCLTTKVDKNFILTRKKWIKNGLKRTEKFDVLDLGAGSKSLKKQRSVSQLIRTSSTRGVYGDVLWKIVHYYKPEQILELGTSVGTGVITMKSANPDSYITTVEGCDETLRRAYQHFEEWKLEKVLPVCANFDEFLKQPNQTIYNLVFLDGNHESKATKRYLDLLMKNTDDSTCFILDDIRWNDDMWKVWNELIDDDRFHLSIDLGRMGLLWKREHQAKEHFVVRPRIFRSKIV